LSVWLRLIEDWAVKHGISKYDFDISSSLRKLSLANEGAKQLAGTFNVYHPQVLKLLMDSLRKWRTCWEPIPLQQRTRHTTASRSEPSNKTPWRQVLDTENIDAFYEAEVHDKVILGGRSVRVYTDNLQESPRRS
jgi:hypothetical protein